MMTKKLISNIDSGDNTKQVSAMFPLWCPGNCEQRSQEKRPS